MWLMHLNKSLGVKCSDREPDSGLIYLEGMEGPILPYTDQEDQNDLDESGKKGKR